MTSDKGIVTLEESADTVYVVIPERHPDRFQDVDIDPDGGCVICRGP